MVVQGDQDFAPLTRDLAVARQSIHQTTTSLSCLRAPRAPSDTTSELPDIPPGLTDILINLLKKFKHTVTSLSLAFKPPITPDAASDQLDHLSTEFARLASCLLASGLDARISAMLEEWLYGLEGLGADLGRLLRAFDAALHDDPSAPIAGSSSALGGESQYLTYTGIVWGAIDRLSAFSSSENEAVIRKWQSQMEVVKDAWTEFKEFLEGQGREPDVENERHSLHEDEDDDDDDDGWGELEAAIGGDKLSPEERDLAEAVKPLLGLHHILHATIPRYIPLLAMSPETSYRSLLELSSTFAATFDAAVTAMYPDQDEDNIMATTKELKNRSTDLVAAMRARLLLAGTRRQEERVQCERFLDKWNDRLALEEQRWQERRLSLSQLEEVLRAA